MNQTLQSAINATSIKAKIEKQESEKTEPNFFDRERIRKYNDPMNSEFENARALGKADGIAFLDSATSEHHLLHKANFARFRDEFGLDARRVVDHFVAKKCEEKNAFPYDIYDPNYVNTLKAKYRPTGSDVTREKMKLYDNFCRALDGKHARFGTRADAAFVDSYTSTYCLKPNLNDMNLASFQPKP